MLNISYSTLRSYISRSTLHTSYTTLHTLHFIATLNQVEFASVIVINKCDLVTPLHLQKVKAVVRALNGEAKVRNLSVTTPYE